jgi:uncharacterized protein (TIGR00725 family)
MVRSIIAVIGIGSLTENDPIYISAVEIGKLLIDHGYRLVTGGLGGVMEAASRGAHNSDRYLDGDVIGFLPGFQKEDANEFVDIPIPTGLGIGRNMILTNADAVIAIGGGAGTLSEMAFAWQKGKLIIAIDAPGWSRKLGGEKIDHRTRHPHIPQDRIFKAGSALEAMKILDEMLPLYIHD